jgi:hypothetical protein
VHQKSSSRHIQPIHFKNVREKNLTFFFILEREKLENMIESGFRITVKDEDKYGSPKEKPLTKLAAKHIAKAF